MHAQQRPQVLITNDDGIDSGFLQALAQSLATQFEVFVAAPLEEQSWIGRAVSRHRTVKVHDHTASYPFASKAWAISGTPTDCVNIALGNLLKRQPDIVVSGINIGYNTTEALILSSGTIAGAIEGAQWGLPAIAFSMCLPNDAFLQISASKGHAIGPFAASLQHACQHAVGIAAQTWQAPPPSGQVRNINFPIETKADSTIVATVPAKVFMGSFYQACGENEYQFAFTPGKELEVSSHTDRAALERGDISDSLLDLSRIGR
jgi:5'-nucleotidase